MSNKCEICGKGPLAGNTVSHAHNKNRMRQLPNLQKVRVLENGQHVRKKICTRCIKSNRITKG
ncbi:MAG: 50S ribosomal protein L28 [Deltaproteobacteria bacterium]|nr:50S ribosomal protein L28 [Deltaproteobacteria bacterium]